MTATKLKTATRRQFETELAKHAGATLDQNTIAFDFHVDAPEGYVWRANGCACLTAPHNSYRQSHRGEAYADLIDRMRMGLDKADPE